jgi:peptidoglycan/LPS O-acetylase OafA/YrhL
LRAPDGFFATIVDHGSVGVLVFFTISGFVLAMPFIQRRIHADRGGDLGRYYLRRLVRIEPPYIVAMVLAFLAAHAVAGRPSFASLGASLGYIHQPLFGDSSPANASAWSLEVEVQWYLVVPLLALVLLPGSRRRRWLTIGVLYAVALLFQVEVGNASVRSFTFLLSWLPFFLVGWLLADITLTGDPPDPRHADRWDLLSLVGWPLLIVTMGSWLSEMLIAPWLIMALCAAAMRGRRTSRVLRTPLLVAIGTMCYSIYLLHYPIFMLVRRAVGTAPGAPFGIQFLFWSLLAIPATLCVAAVFFLLVERPCMDPRWVSKVATKARSIASGGSRPQAGRKPIPDGPSP